MPGELPFECRSSHCIHADETDRATNFIATAGARNERDIVEQLALTRIQAMCVIATRERDEQRAGAEQLLHEKCFS